MLGGFGVLPRPQMLGAGRSCGVVLGPGTPRAVSAFRIP